MGEKSAWKRELRVVLDLLRVWSEYDPPMTAQVGTNRADSTRTLYTPAFNWGQVRRQHDEFVERADAGTLGSDPFPIGGFMQVAAVGIGRPILFPLVTAALRLRGEELELLLRVVAFYVDEHFEWVDAHGWRLDMADPMPSDGRAPGLGHHRFPHVQRITGWLPSESTFFPPGVPSANKPFQWGENMSGPSLNESRPAFPLPVETAGGVVVAAMAALYGASTTMEIFGNVDRPSGELRREANRIVGAD